jgi:hypothetical protein
MGTLLQSFLVLFIGQIRETVEEKDAGREGLIDP